MQATKAHRGLSTARAALNVTWLLARTPDGVRADEVARALGKSVSTAYNLLASLCDEGVAERLPGGLYHLSDTFRETVAEESDRHDLGGVVDDLLTRTHKRAYLAVLRGNQLRVVLGREEIAQDFCCIAAPLLDAQRRFLGAVGIPMSVRAFDNEREALTETLRDIVPFQACADRREVLDRGRKPVLASAGEQQIVSCSVLASSDLARRYRRRLHS